MQLTKIQIENFRSIKSETIVFDHNCIILLGKNEGGKSNILKAIAAVFGQYKVSDKDKRKRIDNEKINEYFVRATLKLSEEDWDEILNRFQSQYTGTEIIVFKNGKTIREYIQTVFHESLIQIDIKTDSSSGVHYWSYEKNDFEFEKDVFFNGRTSFGSGSGTKLELNRLNEIIFGLMKKIYEENPYRCHYWRYNSEYLLSNRIDINAFVANPSTCKSLENMFVLCGREDIKKEFEDAKSQDGDYHSLLEQVSQRATKTFREIWEDFKDTSIKLLPDGGTISAKVSNKTKYSFEDRSDGFKRFICILLMLSTQVHSNKMGERDIILIDEPDQSLYPTSARYLRKELLKMAEKAKIIYATHSQYMIDSNCIDRHLIVEKQDDITTIKKQDKNASFSDDELLRQAIGTSIFECLKDKNIIFEGWLDRELFRKYCEFYKKTNDFQNVETVYLDGISGVKTLIQLLMLANKKFIIVADSDETSNKKREDFNKNYEEFSKFWLAYADVVGNIATMEDFISSEHITKCVKAAFPAFVYDDSKKAIGNIENITKDKNKKQSIKRELIQSISKTDIKDDYAKFINRLKEVLDNL